MVVNLSALINSGLTVGVALSGGGDSMALLHYLHNSSKDKGFNVIAINVEHGIRGDSSIQDTKFVKDYCKKHNIQLVCYSVDCVKKAKEDKLSLEQAARVLRYECFHLALNSKKCDVIATAHHASDNAESVLFNLFRGSGLKGLTGIKSEREDRIIRPFIKCEKKDIEKYLQENDIPFVTDETNLSDDYTRNYIRLNLLPKIKDIFPEVEKSISRFSEIAELEDEYLDKQSESLITNNLDHIKISIPSHRAIFNRAVIKVLKKLGIEKDWEKVHIDDAYNLSLGQNGNSINLPKDIIATKEYDGVVFYKKTEISPISIPFSVGETEFLGQALNVSIAEKNVDLKSGFYADFDKIPKNAIIRTKKDGDVFKKFGGGTKSLSDYFTDKKIPKRIRNELPVIAVNNEILVIFGIAVSDKIKVDDNTTTVIKLIGK